MALLAFFSPTVLPAQSDLLLDDFRSQDKSVFGTTWAGFTDRVMGGLTQMKAGLQEESGQRFLRLEGRVRTENNGGFLQMRLDLEKKGRAYDARPWSGVRLLVRGDPGSYALHLRTTQNWMPWNFYAAALPVAADWSEVKLPFASFKGEYGASGKPDLASVKSLALVAIGKAFDAKLDVKWVGFYP